MQGTLRRPSPLPPSANLVKDSRLRRSPELIRRRLLTAEMSCFDGDDVPLVETSVTATLTNDPSVVVPIIEVLEPTMDHHVAGEAQMVLIGLAGGEGLAVVLSVRVDESLALPASGALDRSSKRPRFPLTVEPRLRTAALTPREAVVGLH
jgi:hypothetical protein